MTNIINTFLLGAILVFIAFDLKITVERNAKVHAILEDIFEE